MMIDRLTSRVPTGVLSLVVAFGLVLAAPGQPQAAAAECGDNSGNLCKKDTDCVNIIFYAACTTDYYYYPQ